MFLSYIRTAVLYLVLVIVVRLMGKRQVGQMEPSEFVVTMLAANLAAVPMQDGGIPLFLGLVPIITVLGMELIFSYIAMKSIRLRKLLCGKPVILVENGRILQNNLRRTGVTMDELSGHLRQHDIMDPRTVQYAILETNGNLSVFPFAKESPASAKDAGIQVKDHYLPVAIITDGCIMQDNLHLVGKDEAWLKKILATYDATVDSTWLLTVDRSDHTIFYRKEAVK